MTFERKAAPLRGRPPFPLLAVAFLAAAGAAFAQDRAHPSARVATQRLVLSAEPDALATASLELANDGVAGSRLVFEITASSTACEAPSPAPWLAAEPASGTIDGGVFATSSVYASAFGAAAPRRLGFLCIATNDDARPLLMLPVVLTIGMEPAFRFPGDNE
jgi:hypothetical protein